MKVKKAEFIKSSQKVEECPEPSLPEYAFIGRSNVGKSTLINMLTERKKLAKTSASPGKTRLINHFLINDQWHLVDLPGYGYAKVSKSERNKFQQFIYKYIKSRSTLACVFVLIDSRHDPQKNDLEFMEWLGKNEIPFAMVFTKVDKLSSSKVQKHISRYNKRMLKDWEFLPEQFITSSMTNQGRTQLLDYIEEINGTYVN